MVEQLTRVVNRNAELYPAPYMMTVEGYPHLLARLMALLHDIAHIPFGHTLEDEGNLFPPEWEDERRVGYWLGEESEIGRTLSTYLGEAGFPQDLAVTLLGDLRTYISAKRAEFHKLEFPFVADLVGNTLCADLLDYIDRDMYFCGLRERGGDRFVTYVSVLRLLPKPGDGGPVHYVVSDEEEARGRVVLLAYRLERGHESGTGSRPVFKRDVLSEAFDLLRRRFSLAEKVYFHRTKESASAMLISAVNEAKIKVRDLYERTDEELIEQLVSSNNQRAQKLATAYSLRHLYKPVYRLDYRKETELHPDTNMLWHTIYPRFRDPEQRSAAERELEQTVGLPEGSISIYCPDKDMNLKKFEMLVQVNPDTEVKMLGDLLDEPRRADMDALNTRFEQLWTLQVFVDPDELNPGEMNNARVGELNGLCESREFFGLPNDIRELRGLGISHVESLANQVVDVWDEAHPEDRVPVQILRQLVESNRRGGAPATREAMLAELEDRMREQGQENP